MCAATPLVPKQAASGRGRKSSGRTSLVLSLGLLGMIGWVRGVGPGSVRLRLRLPAGTAPVRRAHLLATGRTPPRVRCARRWHLLAASADASAAQGLGRCNLSCCWGLWPACAPQNTTRRCPCSSRNYNTGSSRRPQRAAAVCNRGTGRTSTRQSVVSGPAASDRGDSPGMGLMSSGFLKVESPGREEGRACGICAQTPGSALGLLVPTGCPQAYSLRALQLHSLKSGVVRLFSKSLKTPLGKTRTFFLLSFAVGFFTFSPHSALPPVWMPL